jgi:hypothetical protein
MISISPVYMRTYSRVAGSSRTCAYSLRIDFAVESDASERIDSETADLCDKFVHSVWQEISHHRSSMEVGFSQSRMIILLLLS